MDVQRESVIDGTPAPGAGRAGSRESRPGPAGADGVGPSAAAELGARVSAAVGRVVSGKTQAIESAVMTLLAGGHLLIEDVPGVGKTTLATALARSIDADVRRIQFTSDMLPTDVTGLSIYEQDAHVFRFHPGPIFTNIAVADEVNRATPRTQSALLEAMGERAVTVDGRTHRLPELFMVVATQNPHDMEGTFALPEAQRDRFMSRISVGYPDAGAEVEMLAAREASDPADAAAAVASVDDVIAAQRAAGRVHLAEEVSRYLVAIVSATRTDPGISLGGSPRASLHLARMARARAALHGRAFVSPDDVASLAGIVLPHRLAPRGRFASAADALAAAGEVVADIVARTPVG